MSRGELEETLRIIDRTILVRRITLGVFCLLALVIVLSTDISPLNPLFSIPFAWLVLTVPFQVVVHRQRSLPALQWVHAGFFLLETVLLAFLIHRMGGVEWIGVMFYLFTVMYANFFLPKLQGYLITGLAVGSFAALAFLEYLGLIPHIHLFGEDLPPHRDLGRVLATVLVGGIGMYSVLAFTVRAFADLFHRKSAELAKGKERLEKLSLRLLSAQEEERRRIARRLHDELGQELAMARWALAAGRCDEAEKLLARAVEGARDLARELRPPLLDELGLGAALSHLVGTFSESSRIKVELAVPEGRFPQGVEIAVFRTVHEALENIRRHAGARSVEIKIEHLGDSLRGSVIDDGSGFDPSKAEGFGIQSMREWIALVGGKFSIKSRRGKGTEISFEVPLGNAQGHGGG